MTRFFRPTVRVHICVICPTLSCTFSIATSLHADAVLRRRSLREGPDAIRLVGHAANSTTGIPYWSDSGFWCLIVSNDLSNVPITHFYSWTLPPDCRRGGRKRNKMIRRRAALAGIATKLGNRSFRATGITAYLRNGGLIEARVE